MDRVTADSSKTSKNNCKKFSFSVAAWLLDIHSKHFRGFFDISFFPKPLEFYVFWKLAKQLLYLFFGDSSLVPFYLWW